jgi:hypothetical protein
MVNAAEDPPRAIIRDRLRNAPQNVPMIRALLTFVLVFLVATFPATWLLMLFLGNVGTNVGYWGVLPLGILVSALLGGVSANRYSD